MKNKKSLLLVDDEINIIHSLKRILDEDKYNVYSTTVPEEALQIINNNELDVILCDQRMPRVCGIEVLLHARKKSPHTVRILMTGYSDINAAVSAINEGKIFHYFSKPWNDNEVIQKIDEAISYRNEQLEKEEAVKYYLQERDRWLREKDKSEVQLKVNKDRVINSLLKIIKVKDLELFKHSERVAQYALFLADLMELSNEQKEDLKYAALFHDLGKVAIKDEILYKPGKLEENEFKEIQNHTVIGAEIIKELGFMDKISEIILQHHERMDGKGYPKGLTGEHILMEAKILTVADTYDALVSDRIYRRAMDSNTAIEILRMGSNQRYDPSVIEIFCGGIKSEKDYIVHG